MTEVDWWINSTGVFLVGSSSPATMSQCQTPGDSGIQRLTISASATDGSTSTLQFVVTDPHSEDPEITNPGGGNNPGSGNNPVNFTPSAGPSSVQLLTIPGHPQPDLSCTYLNGSTVEPCSQIGLRIATVGTNGVLSYTPMSGAGGSYVITITASNPAHPSQVTSQTFTINISEAPTIMSGPNTTFIAGRPGIFPISTSASSYPPPTVSESGPPLPKGVSFTSTAASGAGLISGTPTNVSGVGGVYSFTITASNGIAPDASQNFTLTVNQTPVWHPSPPATFPDSVSSPKNLTVTATGYPSAITYTATGVPSWASFDQTTGVLSGNPPSTAKGQRYRLTFTAKNSTGTSATARVTLTVGA